MRSYAAAVVVSVLSLVARASFAQSAPPAQPAVGNEAAPQPAGSPPVSVPAGEATLPTDPNMTAGYHGGLFFLRDKEDNFRLYIQGRAQIDSYNYFGPGVADTSLKSTIFLRRIRPELTGEFLHDWSFMIAGDWGQTSNDNAGGTNETFAAKPNTAPSATSGRYASAETAAIKAAPTDVFLIYRPHALFAVQAGQFDAPFSMENRTSDKYLAFMERSLVTRNIGIPANKEMGVMFWGEDPSRFVYYSVGVFNGDGQNRVSPDNRADVFGRVFVHPLASMSQSEIRDLQIGASFHWGDRDPNYTDYDYNSMTTQGNYAYWTPIYNDSLKRRVHVLPSHTQMAVAGELRIPISIVDLQSEVMYVDNKTRESVEGFESTNTERFGDMKGYGYYAQLGFWVAGKRDVNGQPGYENPPHVDLKKADPVEPPTAVQLLLKWEQTKLTYNSADRGGTKDASGIDGDIKVNAFSAGVNYWLTKHVRLTTNYVLNMFPDSAPVAQKTDPAGSAKQDFTDPHGQRAMAPGNTLTDPNNAARFNAHVLHEWLFRVAVAF